MSRPSSLVIVMLMLLSVIACAQPISEQDLKARVESATKDFRDITMTVNVKEKNKAALTKVDPDYARLYEFQTATLSVKAPDKIRIDSKLGMVKFEYIVAGGKKIFRAGAPGSEGIAAQADDEQDRDYPAGNSVGRIFIGRKIFYHPVGKGLELIWFFYLFSVHLDFFGHGLPCPGF